MRIDKPSVLDLTSMNHDHSSAAQGGLLALSTGPTGYTGYTGPIGTTGYTGPGNGYNAGPTGPVQTITIVDGLVTNITT